MIKDWEVVKKDLKAKGATDEQINDAKQLDEVLRAFIAESGKAFFIRGNISGADLDNLTSFYEYLSKALQDAKSIMVKMPSDYPVVPVVKEYIRYTEETIDKITLEFQVAGSNTQAH